jgi:uncharacterized membrane protein YhaH (DUF805 family)
MRTTGNAILAIGLIIIAYSTLAFFIWHDLPPNGGSDGRQSSFYLFLLGQGVAYIGTTVRTLHDTGIESAELKTQFSLRFVLLWVIPSVAIIATLIAWDGPSDQQFFNWYFRLLASVIVIGAVASRYSLSRFRRLAERPSSTPPEK